jgi:hypothetical protein
MSNEITVKVVQQSNPAKKQPQIERLENVTLMYVRLQKPVNKFESTDKEFVLSFVCDEDTSDQFSEKFPKASVKKVKTEQFKDKHGIEPPFPNDKNQYVIKMGVRAEMKDKETGQMIEIPYFYDTRPKVYELSEGKAVDVTLDKMVGNGSKGHIQYAVASNSFGQFCFLRAVLVTDLIEVESSGGGVHNPFSDLGLDVVPAEVNETKQVSKPSQPEQEVKRAESDPFSDMAEEGFS